MNPESFIARFKEYLFSQKDKPSSVTVKNYLSDINHFIRWYESYSGKSFDPKAVTYRTIELYKQSTGNLEVGSAKLDLESLKSRNQDINPSTDGSSSKISNLPLQKLSNRSMERHLSSLRKFFHYLKIEGLTPKDPFEEIRDKSAQESAKIDPFNLKGFKNYLYVYDASHLTIKNYIIDIRQFFAWVEDVLNLRLDNRNWKLDKETGSSRLENQPAGRQGLASIFEHQDPASSFQGLTSKNNVLSYINSNLLEQYKDRLVNEGNFSPATINRKLSSLRKYLSWAEAENLIGNLELNRPFDVRNEKLDKDILKSRLLELKNSSSSTSNLPLQEVGKPEYSGFPPIRLAQKISKIGIFAFDELLTLPFSKAFDKASYLLWLAKGRPIFTEARKLKLEARIPTSIFQLLNPASSFQRRASKVKNIPKEFYAPLAISTKYFPWYKKAWHNLRYKRPKWYTTYHSYPITHYFHFSVLVIFMAVIGFGFYQSFFQKPSTGQPALAALPNAPIRILSFQGRLTDNFDNPISTPSALRFAIYNAQAPASGSALLWQEVDSVSPDQDGIFSILLGNAGNCPVNETNPTGPCAIPPWLFASNSALFLGVSVNTTPEMTPRQQLATVAFAANSETLQGLPPITQSGAGTTNVVLALDSSGNLTIGGSANPTFQASGGQFTISGQPLLLTTNTGSNGNIQLAPEGLGKIDLTKPLVNTSNSNNISTAVGSVEVDDLFSILATSSGQSALTINQTGGGPLISASASGIAKFTVDNSGNTTIATGSIYSVGTSQGQTLSNACVNTTGGIVTGTGVCPAGVPSLDLYWNQVSGSLFPNNSTVDFLFGSQASVSARFKLTANNFGAGTLGVASISGRTSFATLVVNNDGLGDLFTASSSGTNKFSVQRNGLLLAPTYATCTLKTDANGLFTCGTDNSGGGSPFQELLGAIVPNNSTEDFLIGGQSTASAKFSITGISNLSNQVNASLSGQLIVMANNGWGGNATISGALTLGAFSNGVIQTTRNQALTIGGNTTGSITLDPVNSAAGSYIAPRLTGNVDLGTGALAFRNVFGTTYYSGATVGVTSSLGCVSSTLGIVTGSGTCPISNIDTFWNQTAGALYPNNSTADFLFGSQASASARFKLTANNFGAGTLGVASISGRTSFAALVINNDGVGDLFTASASGWTRFAITNAGAFSLKGLYGSNGDCLKTGGNATTAVSWGTCGTGGGSGNSPFAELSTGVIVPNNSTVDFLIGGQSTTSAIFSFTNVNSGTPTFKIWDSAAHNNSLNLLTTATDASITANTGIINIGQGGGTLYIQTDIQNDSNNYLGAVRVSDRFNIFATDSANAAFIVSNTSTGDLLTASAGGTAKFTIGNTGAITDAAYTNAGGILYTATSGLIGQTAIGTSAQCLVGGTTPSFSSSCLFTDPYWNQTSAGILFPNNSTVDFLFGSQASASARFKLTANNFGAGTLGVASISGRTSFATLVVNNDGLGDLFTASSSGTNKFSVQRNGLLLAPTYATCTLKTDANGLFACGVDNAGYSPFQELSGAIVPNNSTLDFLIGGQATTSAKFSITGISNLSNQVNASLSGQLIVMANNGWGGNATISGALTLGAFSNGVIQTTRNQALTIGGNTTGNITLAPLNGITGAYVIPNTDQQVDLGLLTNEWRNVYGTNFYAAGVLLANYWQRNLGTLAPLNITDDLLIGGISSTSALFRVTGGNQFAGTTSVASISAKTSFAAFVIDNQGVGDLFTASKSGATQFKLSNAGVVTASSFYDLNNSAYFLDPAATAVSLNIAGSASMSGNLAFNGTGTNNIYMLNNSSLNFITSAGGTINITPTVTDIGTFSTTSQGQLPQVIQQHTTVAATIGGTTYVYVLGGVGASYLNTVYKAQVDTSGNIGALSTASQGQLPQTLDEHTTVTATIGASTYVYVLGGFTGSARQSTVYKATLNGTTGNVGTFSTASQAQLQQVLGRFTTTTTAVGGTTYIYVLGGSPDGGSTFLSTVYKAQIDTSGNISTAFSTTSQGQLPQTSMYPTSVTATIGASTYVYVLGGYNNTTATQSTVYKATVNGTTGDIGAFSTASQAQLPQALYLHTTVTATIGGENYVYVLGGWLVSTVYKAHIDTNGNIEAFSTALQGQLPQTLGYHTTVTAGIGGTNYVYVLGGSNGTDNQSTVYKATLGLSTTPSAVNTALAITTNPNNSTNLGLDSVGINTSAPTANLDIVGSASLSGNLAFNGTGTNNIYMLNNSNLSFMISPGGAINSQIITNVNVGTFSTASQGQLPTTLAIHTTVTSTIGGTNYVYVLGGTGSVDYSTVYKATIDTSGNIGAFSTASQGQLPQTLIYSTTVTSTIGSSTYMYVLGGRNGATYQSTVYKATVDTSGNIGAFSTASQGQLLTTLAIHTAVTSTIGGTNYVYVLGGDTGAGNQSTVYKATVDTSGNIGAFSTASQGQLPQILGEHTTVTAAIGGTTYVYVLGGGNPGTSTVYKATVDTSGNIGAFSTASQGQLPQTLIRHTTVVATVDGINYVYVFGGFNSTQQSTVYKAAIDTSGNIGAFSTASQAQLQQILQYHTTVTSTIGGTTYVYVLGGQNSISSNQSTVYKATIAGTTTNTVNTLFTLTNNNQIQANGVITASSSSNLRLQASGATSGNGGNGSIYFLDSSGTTRGRVETVVNSNIGTFSTTSQGQLPQTLQQHTTVTTTVGGTNYVYVLGGLGAAELSTVYKATIDTSRNIGAFSTASQGQLPQGLRYFSTVTATVGSSTYVYVLGGYNGTAGQSTLYKATIDTSGNIGAFSTASQGQLPQTLYTHTTVTSTIGGTTYIYVLGGVNASSTSTVYKATIDTSGNIGTFSTASQGQLPQIIQQHTTVTSTIGGATYIYVLGGTNVGTSLSTVYKATIDTSGNIGTFSTASQGQLPQTPTNHTTVTSTIGGTTYMYVLGGASGTVQSTVYKATVDTSGNIGAFSTASQGQLPQTLQTHTTVTSTIGGATYIYVLGGTNATAQSTVYKIQISNYGTLFIGAVDTTNADIAENYPVSDITIGPADVVSTQSSSSAMLVKSSIPYDPHTLGVISTKPGITLGSNDSLFQGDQRPVALKGRVPVKVSTVNGDINVGDALTSSTIAGVAAKATKAGQIIGKALEGFSCQQLATSLQPSATSSSTSGSLLEASGSTADFGLVQPAPTSNESNEPGSSASTTNPTCTGTVLVFVNVGYNDPTPAILTEVSSIKNYVLSMLTDGSYQVTDAAGNVISRAEVLAGAVIGNLRAGVISAKQISTDSLAVVTDNVTIGGQSLRDYIAGIVTQIVNSQSSIVNGNSIISPIAQIDTIHTNLISPIGSNSSIALKFDDDKLSIVNGQSATSSAVSSFDNQGNATFSGQLTSDNLLVTNDASISGTLRAGRILASDIVGLNPSTITNVTNIYNSTSSATNNQPSATSSATDGSLLAANSYIDISSYSGLLANVENLNAQTATFTQGLMSFGPSSFSDVSVVGQLSIDGNLILAGNSINVLGGDLQIQPLRQGGLSVMAGLFYIDTNGNVKIEGDATVKGTLYANVISPIPGNNLTVNLGDSQIRNSKFEIRNSSDSAVLSINSSGDLVASGAGTFSKLNLGLVSPAFALSTTEVIATGSAGTASIRAYQTQITINNPLVTDKSLIYVTPKSNQSIYLMRQVPGVSFTVGIQNPTYTDIPFNWIIVN